MESSSRSLDLLSTAGKELVAIDSIESLSSSLANSSSLLLKEEGSRKLLSSSSSSSSSLEELVDPLSLARG
jgi:hypothetical protein